MSMTIHSSLATKSGTLTVWPVESVAGLVAPLTVSPLVAGSVLLRQPASVQKGIGGLVEDDHVVADVQVAVAVDPLAPDSGAVDDRKLGRLHVVSPGGWRGVVGGRLGRP